MIPLFEYRHVVRSEEIDGLDHANNLAYLNWMQSAAIAHSDAVGWTTSRYFALQAGWVVRSHQIEYLQPAVLGDEVVVKTWVADMKKISSLRRYEMFRAGDNVRLAVAATNWAFIDFQTRRLTRIPDVVASAFTVVTDDAALSPSRGDVS
jgi:acyl-CoA thioester hydrolase